VEPQNNASIDFFAMPICLDPSQFLLFFRMQGLFIAEEGQGSPTTTFRWFPSAKRLRHPIPVFFFPSPFALGPPGEPSDERSDAMGDQIRLGPGSCVPDAVLLHVRPRLYLLDLVRPPMILRGKVNVVHP
jgi:hypothetical protein